MGFRVLVTSKSPIKRKVLEQVLQEETKQELQITSVCCDKYKLPAQPYIRSKHEGFAFAKERIHLAKLEHTISEFDYVVSFENCLWQKGFRQACDVCFVLVLHKGIMLKGKSSPVQVPNEFAACLFNYSRTSYNRFLHGYDCTIGELMHRAAPSIDPKNWMVAYNVDRHVQIEQALQKALRKLPRRRQTALLLIESMPVYPNFPSQAVEFQDMFPLLRDARQFRQVIELITCHYRYDHLDYIVGCEARGMPIGAVVAFQLGVGFLPVRKSKKLPGLVVTQSYKKEYGEDIFEMSAEPIEQARVVIVDDLIATGGSMEAAIALVEQLQCVVVDCCVLREVPHHSHNVQVTVVLQ